MMYPLQKKCDRVIITLVLSLLFIYIAPFIPFLEKHLVTATIIFLLSISAYALYEKAWKDAGIACLLALLFFLSRLFFDTITDTVFTFRATGIAALFFLHFTLFIGPASRFFTRLRSWYLYRRHLGVITFLLALFHESLIIKTVFDFSIVKALALPYVFFGMAAFGIMILLAATSWNRSQRNQKKWYWDSVHIVSFLSFILFSLYFLNIQNTVIGWHYVVIALCAATWLLLAPWGIAQKIHSHVNGWKQIHYLVYICYILTILHVWIGRAQFQDLWIQALFWLSVFIVVTMHAIGHLRAWKKKWEKKKKR